MLFWFYNNLWLLTTLTKSLNIFRLHPLFRYFIFNLGFLRVSLFSLHISI